MHCWIFSCNCKRHWRQTGQQRVFFFFKLVREFFWTGERVFIGKLVRVFFELVREWWETKAASAGSKWQQPLSRLWGYEYSFTRTYHRLWLTNNFGKKREERNITSDGELQPLIWGQDSWEKNTWSWNFISIRRKHSFGHSYFDWPGRG